MANTAPTLPRIFLSYARKDGKTLAQRLSSDLRAQGYDVWLDLKDIGAGTSWSVEIEEALKNADVTLALLSHGSFVSEICRAEQVLSLDLGKRLIPLLVQQDSPRPVYLYTRQYLDFADDAQYAAQLTALMTALQEPDSQAPAGSRTVVNTAPQQPPNFVARAEALDSLRSTVLGDDTDRSIAVTAVQGMGGIGKSVLVAALCHDAATQAAFPDGILWVSIGKTPGTLVEPMRMIGTALGDDPSEYTTEQAASARLRALLPDKAALIVLDDVWEAKHVEPFRANADRVRLVFTTRNAEIALGLGAENITLDRMTDAEAILLLREWAKRDDPAMDDIAKRLGNLPLALKLAGARLREGMTGRDWLTTFTRIEHIKLGRRSTDASDNLQVCFELSINELTEADRQLFHALGIFAEDALVPEAAIVRLWQKISPTLDSHACGELITDLGRLALIERDIGRHTVTLHDLLHDYTREQLGDPLNARHQELLDAYRHEGQRWAQTPDDGYLYDHLVYHLVESHKGDLEAQSDALAELFDSQDWLRARYAHSGYSYYAYSSDIMKAWNVEELRLREQMRRGASPTAFARFLRCALIRTSINSLAANIPPELVARAVELGTWTPERGLALAWDVPNHQQRARVNTLLAATGRLSPEQSATAVRRAARAASLLRNIDERAAALEELAVFLPPDMLVSEIEALNALASEKERARLLCILARQVTAETYDAASAAAAALTSTTARSSAMALLCAHATASARETVVGAVLQALVSAPSNTDLRIVIPALAPLLTPSQARRVIDSLRTLSDERAVARALETLIPFLTDDNLAEVRRMVDTLRRWDSRARLMLTLVPCLPSEQAQDTLSSALMIVREKLGDASRLGMLQLYGPYLSSQDMEASVQEALDFVAAAAGQRSSVLIEVCPYLSGNDVLRAARMALMISEPAEQQAVMAALLPQIDDTQLQTILTAMPSGYRTRVQLNFMTLLGPKLPAEYLTRQLAVTAQIRDEREQIKALAIMLDHLPPTYIGEALQRVRLIENENDRARSIERMAKHLSPDLLPEALEIVRSIYKESARADALSALAQRLGANLMEEALDVCRGISWEFHRMRALTALYPRMTPDHMSQALEDIRAFQVAEAQARALTGLLPYAATGSYAVVAAEMRRAMDAIDGRVESLRAGMGAFAHLDEAERTALLASASSLLNAKPPEETRATIITLVAPHLIGDALAQAGRIALEIRSEVARVRALSALVPRLDAEDVRALFDTCAELRDEALRAQFLLVLAAHLPSAHGDQVLAITRSIRNDDVSADALVALIPLLGAEFSTKIADIARGIAWHAPRARVLASLYGLHPSDELRHDCREALLAALRRLRSFKRESVLHVFAEVGAYLPAILSMEQVEAAADQILDICAWDWG